MTTLTTFPTPFLTTLPKSLSDGQSGQKKWSKWSKIQMVITFDVYELASKTRKLLVEFIERNIY